MVRLEREGNSYVFITGNAQNPNVLEKDINILVNALSELGKTSPDPAILEKGLLFIDSSNDFDIRNEIKNVIKKALKNEGTGLLK